MSCGSASTLDELPRNGVPVKSLVDLLEVLLRDCGRKCDVDVRRDVQTLRARVEHEGDGVITFALPAFCVSFERSLADGRITPAGFPTWGRLRGIPKFLQGFLGKVFDKEGSLLDEPSIVCIRAVRQLCLFGKKILRPCAVKREQDAIDDFVKCDSQLAEGSGQLDRYFRVVARLLGESINLDEAIRKGGFIPSHGPGQTQERYTGNRKWRFETWHRRLNAAGFSYAQHGRGSVCVTEALRAMVAGDWPQMIEPADEKPVRVTLVPKTLKSPRIIAVEPVCMQFAQQALKRLLVDALERGPMTAGQINFSDQSVNQRLALSSSRSGFLSTIDMKEASDRVSVSHAMMLFESSPNFRTLLFAARSTCAQLPSGDVIPLKKFASMGSATCFPVEALAFFTGVVASRILRSGRFPTARLVLELGRDVYVYGDDLLLPADETSVTCDDLETLGFLVNRRKSFWTGKFRESCGSDCYDGSDVTPVYVRRDLPTSELDSSGILSTVSTAAQLEKAGYVETAAAFRQAVEEHLGPLPHVPEVPTDLESWFNLCRVSRGTPAIGWTCHSEVRPHRRWVDKLQCKEYLHWTANSPVQKDPLDGDPALAKCLSAFATRSNEPWTPADYLNPLAGDDWHLTQSSRPYSLTLQRRWVLGPA